MTSYWPCPNNCLSWCRPSLFSMTNHHPQCEHVDKSLIDVWEVNLDGRSYVTNSEKDANDNLLLLLEDDPDCGVRINKLRMHREIYENLPEFDGF